MTKLWLIAFGFCFLAIHSLHCETFASPSCESIFQKDATSFRENHPLFAMTHGTQPRLLSARIRVALSRMKSVIAESGLAEYLELAGTQSDFSIKEVRPGLYSVAIGVKYKSTGTTTFSEIVYALDDLIIVSFPKDLQQSNRVFRFENDKLVETLPLNEFLIRNIHEQWVALSRSMQVDEATSWRTNNLTALTTGGRVHIGYDRPVYHFQLGYDNAYRSPHRELLKFQAPKAQLLDAAMKKRLWASMNLANRGVHGLLFEIVIAADQVPLVPLKIESALLD